MDAAAMRALFAPTLEQLGLTTFRQGVEAPMATPPGRGPIEKLGVGTYGREVRRSPADGTFRTKEEMLKNWDAFKQPYGEPVRDAMSRALMGTPRDPGFGGAMPGTRITDLW